MEELEKNDVDMQNCRGQGYDNSVNILGVNSRGLYQILIPCYTPVGTYSKFLCDSRNIFCVYSENLYAILKFQHTLGIIQ